MDMSMDISMDIHIHGKPAKQRRPRITKSSLRLSQGL